ncbi:MAG: NADH:flavin oxidoreductase [Treponema sp.]|jgi:2,4-dienoyl-CoA reductase-like NADH-dependent reductase (Old Yellow Enzyme family)|nr:NADH:flavin oxidoreductase [Treponema sp.]
MNKSLFDEIRYESFTLKNRFFRSAFADRCVGGTISSKTVEFYCSFARGGVGSIISGYTVVDEAEKESPHAAIYNDTFIDSHRRLTDAVHEYGTAIFLQLNHVGSRLDTKDANIVAAAPYLAPSAVMNLRGKTMPREITAGEIKNLQEKFAAAAVRGKKAGYDGVELHSAHGYFLSQFMTPYYNRRTDRYGGSGENRARMLLETIQAVQDAAGKDYPVLVKLNVFDGIKEGIPIEDVLYTAGEVKKLGIFALETSGNWHDYPEDGGAFFLKQAETIAAKYDLALILTGGNRNYADMTDILNRYNIAYFGICRPLIKNPNLVNDFR